jgi:hypothetical protein
MAWFRKKPDPISDRAQALNQEIARLESQIQRLDAQVQHDQSLPRLRSTVSPHTSTVSHPTPPPPTSPAPPHHEPIFEEVSQNLLEGHGDAGTLPEHFNELGVRKYDLPALLRRIREHFRGPSTSNPKLVSYLAAGGIQGLKPLRYEKRVARNRFLFFVIILFLALLGTLYVFLKGHR